MPMPHAPCPMPIAQCPMPLALYPQDKQHLSHLSRNIHRDFWQDTVDDSLLRNNTQDASNISVVILPKPAALRAS
jgi:hypothetical protein